MRGRAAGPPLRTRHHILGAPNDRALLWLHFSSCIFALAPPGIFRELRGMDTPPEIPAWKDELDAIVGARAHGQFAAIYPRLKALDERHPQVAEINYQLAWTADTLGRLNEALPYYEKAVALGLPPNELSGALIGLGSTLRALGQADRSAEVLRSGKLQFPDNAEFDAFLALTFHAQGQHAAALQLAIDTLCSTTEDPGLTAYQRALRHAASKL